MDDLEFCVERLVKSDGYVGPVAGVVRDLWDTQRGICMLSGVEMDIRSVQPAFRVVPIMVDHQWVLVCAAVALLCDKFGDAAGDFLRAHYRARRAGDKRGGISNLFKERGPSNKPYDHTNS